MPGSPSAISRAVSAKVKRTLPCRVTRVISSGFAVTVKGSLRPSYVGNSSIRRLRSGACTAIPRQVPSQSRMSPYLQPCWNKPNQAPLRLNMEPSSDISGYRRSSVMIYAPFKQSKNRETGAMAAASRFPGQVLLCAFQSRRKLFGQDSTTPSEGTNSPKAPKR